MRAVIICGGDIGNIGRARAIIRDDDMVICADSGYKYAKEMGIAPFVVLGDFDSYDKSDVTCDNVRVYPSKKDFTDSEIAVEYAREHGADEVLLLAATGGRIDHTLGNVYLLKTIMQRGMRGCIFDGVSTVWLVRGEISLCGGKGDLLSVIPFAEASDFTTHGLEYVLTYDPLPSTGISNVFTGERAGLEIGSGEAIVIYTPAKDIT